MKRPLPFLMATLVLCLSLFLTACGSTTEIQPQAAKWDEARWDEAAWE